MPAPQLCDPIPFADLLRYVDDDNWSFEQKIDGVRMMICINDGVTTAVNRRGEMIPIPKPLVAFADEIASWDGRWSFDGEYLDGVLWVFDMPGSPVDKYESAPYRIRREILAGIASNVTSGNVEVLPYHSDPIGKRILMRDCININAEGIVAKKLSDSQYRFGKRVPWTLKAKLWASADVIVSVVSPEGKQSVEIQVVYQGRRLEVGSCKVPEKILANLQVDDVIECKYLYASKKHRLYQPSFLKVRDDKAPEECTLDQLKPVNKQVLLP